MRILAMTNLYPNPGEPGRGLFNRQLIAALAREHDVEVIAPIAWTQEWQARGARNTLTRGGIGSRLGDGVVIHHPTYFYPPGILRGSYGWFFLRSVGPCVREAVQRFRPEVVLASWAYPDGWAAVRLARDAGLAVAIRVHGSDVLGLGRFPARQRRTADALRAADAVIACSEDLARQIVAMGVRPGRVHVIHNGVDTELFQPGPRDVARQILGIPQHETLILFVGRLAAVKGLDVLLDALAILAHEGVRFRCAVVGEGPLRTWLQERAAGLGLHHRTWIVGARAIDELPRWYQSANLVVLPSLSEGVPNVLREAAACGIPFVASAVGGIPEISRTEALVPPGDPRALAAKMRAGLMGALGSSTATDAARRSWQESARATAGVLAGIMPGVEGPRKLRVREAAWSCA